MYEEGTILALKEPRSTEDEAFPYDRVEVIGQSPVHHGIRAEEWVGANGQGVIVTPLAGFDSTIDEPYGKLQELYEVESIPEAQPNEPQVKVITPADLGPSPEDTFADAASKQGKPSGRRAVKRAAKRSKLDGEVQDFEHEAPDLPNRGADEESAPEATG